MKNLLFFCCLLALLSCDDGELQIEALNFDSVAAQSCTAPITTVTRVFFKINQDETLILNMAPNIIRNEVSDGFITSLVPSQSKITYRIFDGNVTRNYFCDPIPAATPAVLEEIEAQGGEVRVTTTLNADGVTFEHKIELNSISLVTQSGTRITDLRINNFGTITTLE